MKHFIIIGAISMALFSCGNSEEVVSYHAESYQGALRLNDSTTVIFNATYTPAKGTLTIQNGVHESFDVELHGEDTLRGTFPVFASDLWLVKTDKGYEGMYFRTDAENYEIPLTLERLDSISLTASGTTEDALPSNQYYIIRDYGNGTTRPALLQLGIKENKIVGTIATSTGDLRFLTGEKVVDEGGYLLTGFDGRFINNVEFVTIGDSVFGNVWSGKTGYYSFKGVADESATLENPEEMSKLRDDYTHIEWHLPGLDGDTVHFDSRTVTKPTILAIQGSWCPNCMDEGRVLDMYYREFEGAIDVYGLSYEYSGTLEKATAAVQKMERDLGTSFPMVIATYDPKQDRNAVLPLEQIRSYPTSIMLDHEGNVVKIHTGFYGPSTKEYEAYVKETREELEALVAKANG
jgi:thiol-disulfide isomerase/thioredoxin